MNEQKPPAKTLRAIIAVAERSPDPTNIHMEVTGNPAEVITITLWEDGFEDPVIEPVEFTVPESPADPYWRDDYAAVETSSYTLEAENGDYAVATIAASQTLTTTPGDAPLQIMFPDAPADPTPTTLTVIIREDVYVEDEDVMFYKYTINGSVHAGNHSLWAIMNEPSPGGRESNEEATPGLIDGNWVAEAELTLGGGDPFALLVRYRGHNYAWKLYP